VACARLSIHCGTALRRVAILLAGFVLTSCSLLTIKSPETPLTAREQEARLLTRDYAAHFATIITHLMDDAPRGETDPAIRSQELRLKLGAVTEITRAATGLPPIASLWIPGRFRFSFVRRLTLKAGVSLRTPAAIAATRLK
jgi:hypothetical protein